MTDAEHPPTFVDTHAHLDDDQFGSDIEGVIVRSAEAGVKKIVNIGYEPSKWASTIALGRRFSGVSFTLGLHPQSAGQYNHELLIDLEKLVVESGAVAIGEIGLDLYRSGPSPELQTKAFEAQLDIAKNLDLPVVIHQRAATESLHRVLERATPTIRCVLHSFEGDQRLVDLGLERGYFFGVGGLMTRERNQSVRELLRLVPLDRMLLETDSPYLVPAGIKAIRNEPANIPRIASKLAELLSVEVKDVADTTTRNAIDIFRLD
jgi:TatD DNase family protein